MIDYIAAKFMNHDNPSKVPVNNGKNIIISNHNPITKKEIKRYSLQISKSLILHCQLKFTYWNISKCTGLNISVNWIHKSQSQMNPHYNLISVICLYKVYNLIVISVTDSTSISYLVEMLSWTCIFLCLVLNKQPNFDQASLLSQI